MSEIINYIPYLGNKKWYVDKIIHKIGLKNKYLHFVEPFAGSGVVSLNISARFNDVDIILNELDLNIYKIHKSFKYGNFEQFNSIINEIYSFGDPKENKEDYYTARNELNKKYFKEEFSIKQGFYYYAICTFAINSMVRFGPNGFNQGWGHRGIGKLNNLVKFNKNEFDKINSLYKPITLYNEDYKNILEKVNNKSFIFLDPPYSNKQSGTYSFTYDDHKEFINVIKNLNNKILYTDVFSQETLEMLGNNWNCILLRENLGKAKPGKTKAITKEALYFNFNINTNSLF